LRHNPEPLNVLYRLEGGGAVTRHDSYAIKIILVTPLVLSCSEIFTSGYVYYC